MDIGHLNPVIVCIHTPEHAHIIKGYIPVLRLELGMGTRDIVIPLPRAKGRRKRIVSVNADSVKAKMRGFDSIAVDIQRDAPDGRAGRRGGAGIGRVHIHFCDIVGRCSLGLVHKVCIIVHIHTPVQYRYRRVDIAKISRHPEVPDKGIDAFFPQYP